MSERVLTNQRPGTVDSRVRYDITNYANWGDYRREAFPTDPRVNGVFFQTDFTF
jgi:hypothetical protein